VGVAFSNGVSSMVLAFSSMRAFIGDIDLCVKQLTDNLNWRLTNGFLRAPYLFAVIKF